MRLRSPGWGIVAALTAFVVGISTLGPAAPAAAATLTNVGMALSNPIAGATGTTYTWTFTVPTAGSINSFLTTVPTGTGGAPTGVTVTGLAPYVITWNVGSPTLSGTTLTIPTSSEYAQVGTVITITAGGLTNTSTAGDYTSTVTTRSGGTPVDTGTSSSTPIAAAALTSPYWWPSTAITSATGATYNVQFTTTTAATLASVVITGPAGIGGTPTLSSISGLPGGGSISRSGSTITYTFTATAIAAGTPVSLAIGGLTNPSTAGGSTLLVLTRSASAPVDAVRTGVAYFTAGALTSPSWSADSTAVGATGVSYTYTFVVGTSQQTDRFIITLPPGTAGTPSLVQLTAVGGYNLPLTGGTVSRSGTTLTVDFTGVYVPSGFTVTIVVGGMTNTATAGAYVAPIVSWRTDNSVAIDTGLAAAVAFTSTTLTGISWSASSNLVSSTGVTYLYTFGISATSTIDVITMTLPAGTAGTPTVTSVTPAGLAGGTVARSGTTLTYTLPSAQSVNVSATVQLAFGGFTNTATAGSYTSTLVARLSGSAVASGTTPAVGFASSALVSPSWTSTSQVTGVASTYTFGLTTPAAGMNATSITFTLPAGTTGTPALGTVSAYYSGGPLTFTGTSIARAGTTLTFSFTGPYLQDSTTISIGVTGLTNTTTPGSYSSTMTIFNNSNPMASGASGAVGFSSISAVATWSSSSSAVSATAVSYTYGLTLSASASVTKVTMTLPAGTTGTPTLGTVTPGAFAGGTLTSSGNLLTYTFTATTLAASQLLSITVTGITNTATAGSYSTTLTVYDAGAAVIASASSSAIGFTASALTGVTWAASSTDTSQTAVTYTWTFTTASTGTLSQVTMSVPSGTAGTPALVSASTSPAVTLAGAAVALSGTTLTLSFTAVNVPAARTFTVVVSGFTNTPTAGSYSSSVVTKNAGVPRDSGVSANVTFITPVPAALSWSASGLVAGTPGITETFVFTTSTTTATVNNVVFALPAGTTGTPTILALTPAGIASGATVSLSGSNLTLNFTSTSLAGQTVINLQVGGLTQTSAPGPYTVTGTSRNGITVVDTATSTAMTVAARTLTTTVSCSATNACRSLPSGVTQLEILLIPGVATPVTASVQLGVTTNAPYGYVVSVASSPLTSGAAVLPQASTSGEGSIFANQFGATATLTPGGVSSPALCGAYAGGFAQIGYPAAATALWRAAAGTGVTTDSVVISNHLKVSAVQPAGIYTGTITYSVLPRYTSGTGC